jgi:hypothetical protein
MSPTITVAQQFFILASLLLLQRPLPIKALRVSESIPTTIFIQSLPFLKTAALFRSQSILICTAPFFIPSSILFPLPFFFSPLFL